MYPYRWYRWTVCLALLLVGWGTAAFSTSTDGTSSPVSVFLKSEDCMIGVGAQAWVDENADGRRDADEEPLAGVTLIVYEQRSQPSDAQGIMTHTFLGPCDPGTTPAVLTAEPPPGFTPTTPQPVTTTFQSLSRPPGKINIDDATFGFRPTP